MSSRTKLHASVVYHCQELNADRSLEEDIRSCAGTRKRRKAGRGAGVANVKPAFGKSVSVATPAAQVAPPLLLADLADNPHRCIG